MCDLLEVFGTEVGRLYMRGLAKPCLAPGSIAHIWRTSCSPKRALKIEGKIDGCVMTEDSALTSEMVKLFAKWLGSLEEIDNLCCNVYNEALKLCIVLSLIASI